MVEKIKKMKTIYFFFIGLFLLTTASTCSKKVSDASNKSNSKKKATYKETHRPQYHFSPANNWAGDPTGLVYYDGEYHLFYQHNIDGSNWSNQHWGHAISKDLMKWEELPVAIFPDSIGTILSGSVVMDWKNSSKFGTPENPPMVAMFTYENAAAKKSGANNFQTQGVAYSLDKGRTWQKHEHNPVIINPGIKDFRNPKIFWHKETFKWVMVISAGDHIKIFASPNLTYWVHMTDFGKEVGAHKGVWESPDLIPVQVEGIKDSTAWVLLQSINDGAPNGGSGTQYFIGNFQGKYFFSDQTEPLWMDYGRDNYGGNTFADVPDEDGRKLLMGWMNNWDYASNTPTEPWRGSMTIPRELSLRPIDGQLRLISQPAKEIQILRGTAQTIEAQKITSNLDLGTQHKSEIILEFDLSNSKAKKIGIELSNDKKEMLNIGFDASKNQFFVDRQKAGPNNFSPEFATQIDSAPRFSKDKKMKLHLFIDAASVELFADDGASVISETFFVSQPFTKTSLYANGGHAELSSGVVYPLAKTVIH